MDHFKNSAAMKDSDTKKDLQERCGFYSANLFHNSFSNIKETTLSLLCAENGIVFDTKVCFLFA